MTALPRLWSAGAGWLASALLLWALFLGIPVFVGHRHGAALGCLTAITVFLAAGALGRLALPERA